MRGILIAIVAVVACLAVPAIAQEENPSLGDLARQERERREATRATAEPGLGTPPPAPLLGELIPAHFLRFEGEVAQDKYSLVVNGKPLSRNSRVRGLPIYVLPFLLEGSNQLEIEFQSHSESPLDVIIEERFAGETEHRELVHFHADPGQYANGTHQKLAFTAHPRAVPDVVLTDKDRVAIHSLVRTFYDEAVQKDSEKVMALFEPALEDARKIYPEGAAFGKEEMLRFAYLTSMPECVMEPYNPAGLTLSANGNVVTVTRNDGGPVFSSSDVPTTDDATPSHISVDAISIKKINDVWRLTLPFGF